MFYVACHRFAEFLIFLKHVKVEANNVSDFKRSNSPPKPLVVFVFAIISATNIYFNATLLRERFLVVFFKTSNIVTVTILG